MRMYLFKSISKLENYSHKKILYKIGAIRYVRCENHRDRVDYPLLLLHIVVICNIVILYYVKTK